MLGAITDLSRNADPDKHLLVGTSGLHMMFSPNNHHHHHHHLFAGLRHQINPSADGGCRTSGTVSSTLGSDTVSQVLPDALPNSFIQTEDVKGIQNYVTSWFDASRSDEPPSIETTYKDFSSPLKEPSKEPLKEPSRSNNRTTFSGVKTPVATEVTSRTASCEPWRLRHPMVSPITCQHQPGRADHSPNNSNEQFPPNISHCQVNATEVMDRSSRCSPPTGSHSYDNQTLNVASRPDLDLVYQDKAMDVDEKEERYLDGFTGAKDRNSLLVQEEQNSLEVSSETQNAMESSDSSLPPAGSAPPHHRINECPQTGVGEKCILDMRYSPLGDQKWSTTDRALCIVDNRDSCQQDVNNTDDGEDESDEGMSMARFQQMTNSVQPDRAGVYFCHLCDFTGRSRQEFQSHLYAHYDYRCLKCDYTSRTEGRLKRHVKDFHSKVPPDNFSGKSIKTSRPKLQRCKQCNFVTETKDEFWQHLRAHIKEDKRLECSLCHFVTEYKHHMEYHMRNHEGSKPYKCCKCNYECVNKSMLNSHMKSHSNVYPYRCSNCHYATKYCHSLKLHLAKHNHKPAVVLNADGSLPSYDNTEEILTVRRGSSLRLAATSSRRTRDLDLKMTQEGEHFPANLLSGHVNGPDSLQTSSAPQFYSQTTSLPNSAGLMLPSPGLLDPCTFLFPSLVNQLKLSSSLFLSNSNNKEVPTNGVDLSVVAPSTRCASPSTMMASLLSTCMLNGINAKSGLPVKTEATGPNFSLSLPLIPPNSPSTMSAFMAASCLLSSSGASAVSTTNETDVKPIDYLTNPVSFNEAPGASSYPGTSPNPFLFSIAKQDNHVIAGNSRNIISDQSLEQDYKKKRDREYATIDGEFALDLSTKTTLGSVKLPSDRSNDDMSRRGHREDSSSVGLRAVGLRATDRENNIIKSESCEDRTFAYECPFCEIRFRQRALYDVHMGFHSHQDPYLCNQCGHKSLDSVTFFIHLGKMAHYS